MSVFGLLSICHFGKWKVESSLHDLQGQTQPDNNDQHNLPRAAQISVWFKTCFFWEVNNGANTSKLTSANLSKSHCVNYLNTLLPYILCLKEELLQMHMQ